MDVGGLIRVTIRAIFPGWVLARISMTSKYHTDGSLCLSRVTLMSKTDRFEPRCFKSNTPNMYAYLHHFDRRSHLLAHHDWSIMYNACMLLVKLLFDHCLQWVWKQENKAKTNSGKDVSGKNGTYGHPRVDTILFCTSFHVVFGLGSLLPWLCLPLTLNPYEQ